MESRRREIVRQLSKSFPADKIEEAIKRLVERRYVVNGASHAFAGAVAGYWASLGLPPEVAEQNLRNCPVRVESIDVKGAKELGAALSKLGVQITKRSPKLVITLVNDYLDRRLAEVNRNAWPIGRPGCWCSRPACFRWWDLFSNRAKAPAGPVCSIA